MSVPLVLLFVIFIIPVIAVYIWFRTAKYQLSLIRFLLALLAGAAAFFPALVLQDILRFSFLYQGRGAVFYNFFIRIAFTEEFSRLLILFIFFFISSRINPNDSLNQPITDNIIKKGTAIGLIAGFGFAILESARYAASDMNIRIALLRIFTAALHGACSARTGSAVVIFRKSPIQAFLRFLTAVAIHGVYNLMVAIPGLPSITAILIALSAISTSILSIRGGWNETSETTLDKTIINQ
jgi:RsiW-degrading membrane proteinase PrsW (M82 family)